MSRDDIRRRPLSLIQPAIILVLFGLLIASQREVFEARQEASDYREEAHRERIACRNAVLENRIDGLEDHADGLLKNFHRPKETVNDYKGHVDAVRRRWSNLVRPERPIAAVRSAKPSPAPVATARADEPAEKPVTVVGCKGAKENAEQFEKLQAWVREHLRAWHGVEL